MVITKWTGLVWYRSNMWVAIRSRHTVIVIVLYFNNCHTLHIVDLIKAPPTRGRLFVFVRFCPPVAAAPRMGAASHPYPATLISTKPFFQFIWCSTYWIQVLIPKLYQFFRKFGKIFGSWRPSLILSPWYLQSHFFDSLWLKHTGCKY